MVKRFNFHLKQIQEMLRSSTDLSGSKIQLVEETFNTSNINKLVSLYFEQEAPPDGILINQKQDGSIRYGSGSNPIQNAVENARERISASSLKRKMPQVQPERTFGQKAWKTVDDILSFGTKNAQAADSASSEIGPDRLPKTDNAAEVRKNFIQTKDDILDKTPEVKSGDRFNTQNTRYYNPRYDIISKEEGKNAKKISEMTEEKISEEKIPKNTPEETNNSQSMSKSNAIPDSQLEQPVKSFKSGDTVWGTVKKQLSDASGGGKVSNADIASRVNQLQSKNPDLDLNKINVGQKQDTISGLTTVPQNSKPNFSDSEARVAAVSGVDTKTKVTPSRPPEQD